MGWVQAPVNEVPALRCLSEERWEELEAQRLSRLQELGTGSWVGCPS